MSLIKKKIFEEKILAENQTRTKITVVHNANEKCANHYKFNHILG